MFGDAADVIRQWPALSTWATIFYTFVHILPANLVRCYIFRQYLRYPFTKVLAGLLLLITLECLCQLGYGRIFSVRLGFLFYWVYFTYLCIMTRVPFSKQVCLIMPLGLVWHFLMYLAYTVEYYLPMFPVPFFESGLVLLLELLGCLYFLWLYSERFAAPLLAEHSVPKLWAPLAFLSFTILVLSILASPFNEDRTLAAFVIRLAASLGGLTGTLIALYAVREAIARRQLNSILAVAQELREVEQEQYAKLGEAEKNTRTVQQKLKTFVQQAEGLLERGNYEAVEAYAGEFLEEGAFLDGEPICGNELVNALVNYWQPAFRRLGVKTSMAISLGSHNPVEPLHMTAILGNLLRNAAEALSRMPDGKERRLRLALQQIGGTVVIVVDNTFDGCLKQDEEQNYLSIKRGFAQRGVGLDSVRSSVEQCGGTFTVQVLGQNFESSVVLPLQAGLE